MECVQGYGYYSTIGLDLPCDPSLRASLRLGGGRGRKTEFTMYICGVCHI